MVFPTTTAIYAALFSLIFAGLSIWVVMGRVSSGTLLGADGNDALGRRVRSHGNFAEYVPLTLLLIGLLEASGASQTLVQSLLGILIIARLLHPIGMFAATNSPRQFACRGGGILATLVVMVATAVALLARTL